MITSIDEAIKILGDKSYGELNRVKAARFLSKFPEEKVVEFLVCMLHDDDFGVRWETSASLAKLGRAALPPILKALIDPDRVGDTRLRKGAYLAIKHMDLTNLPKSIVKLLEALEDPAVSSMEEASRVMIDLEALSKREAPSDHDSTEDPQEWMHLL